MSMIMALSRLESVLRRTYVNIHNRRLIARYVLSPLYLANGVARTVLGGVWNAQQLSSTPPAAGPILFTAQPSEDSRVQFLLQLSAIPLEAVPAKTSVDIVIHLTQGCEPGPFASIARCLPRPLNLHFAWSSEQARRLLATMGGVGAREAAPVALQGAMVGRLQPRQIYVNTAREHLKGIDWSCRFCAVSATGANADVLFHVIAASDAAAQRWRFILLGGDLPDGLADLAARLTVAAHSGLDLPTQIALAMECDAYLGDWNLFAAAAALAGRPTLTDHGETTLNDELAALMRQPQCAS